MSPTHLTLAFTIYYHLFSPHVFSSSHDTLNPTTTDVESPQSSQSPTGPVLHLCAARGPSASSVFIQRA